MANGLKVKIKVHIREEETEIADLKRKVEEEKPTIEEREEIYNRIDTLEEEIDKKVENTVNSIDDLEGKSIGVQLGTTGDIYASDYEGDEALKSWATSAIFTLQYLRLEASKRFPR